MGACCIANFGQGVCRLFFPLVIGDMGMKGVNYHQDKESAKVDSKVQNLWDAYKTSLSPRLRKIELKEMPIGEKVEAATSKINIRGNNVVYLFTGSDVGERWSHVAMFFAKYEIALLSSEAHIRTTIVSLIICVAASVFCVSWYMPLIFGFVSLLVGITIYGKMSNKAYDYAFEHATPEELQELKQFLNEKIILEEHNPDSTELKGLLHLRYIALEKLRTNYGNIARTSEYRQEVPIENSLLSRKVPVYFVV